MFPMSCPLAADLPGEMSDYRQAVLQCVVPALYKASGGFRVTIFVVILIWGVGITLVRASTAWEIILIAP